jgi:NAD(P)-dependent dehydrogenase (short-subunit alcohol dehydrogenase family)
MTRVAVITGAARGIGRATAKRFVDEGWCVALIDIEKDQLAETVIALAKPAQLLGVTCDVSSEPEVKAAFAAIHARFGQVDALVNNAGVAMFGSILQTTLEQWSRIMAVNLTGPFLCSQAAARLMSERGKGAIVNITSISGIRASTLRVAYGTSKAGLAHLTKQQAVEFAGLGVRVNAVAPGPVETAMAKAVHSPEIRKDYHDAMPLGRYGLEEELAAAIYFLCSDEASYITGQILGVDGGFQAAGIGLSTLRKEHEQNSD